MSTTTPHIDWKNRLPTWLTLSRMVLTPFIIACLYHPDESYGYWAAGLFILAALTDWWDGHFARRFQVVSNFGKFMDPIADKILVSSTLIMLIPLGRVDAVMVVVLIARDILIGGLRSVAAADNVILDAKASGKWKTALQMMAIPAVLLHGPVLNLPLPQIGYLLLWISVLLSVSSALEYFLAYLKASKAP